MAKKRKTTMNKRMSGSLFDGVPCELPEESCDILLRHDRVRLERIVSTGHATPAGRWYDQPQAEWVLVVKGEAGLRFEDEDEARPLKAGDYLFIPPHARHRVEWTSAREPTIWLALHLPRGAEEGLDR
jgi:cupin 2 domain-containing protein